MGPAEENWAAVGAQIEKRIAELKLTTAEVLRRSGLSFKTLAGYIAGRPIRRQDKARELCAALEWSADSIERILRGEDPLPLGAPSEDGRSLAERVADLERRFAEIEERLETERRDTERRLRREFQLQIEENTARERAELDEEKRAKAAESEPQPT